MQPVQRATSRSKALTVARGVLHTGVACSLGNSPGVSRILRTIFDAGKKKSSTISYKRRIIQINHITGKARKFSKRKPL